MAGQYLSGFVYYHQDVGVVDVQTIINQITTMALAATPAWTNPVAGKIVSPLDASGRQMTIQFNRIAATNLEMVVTDGSLRTSTRRAQIAGGGSTVNYYIGQFHMALDWLNGATPEGLWSVMLDESPESQTSHNMWLVMNGSRTAGDALDGNWLFGSSFLIRSANVFAILNNGILAPIYNAGINQSTNGFISRTLGGSNIWCPLIAMGDFPGANVFNIYGKYYQCLVTRGTYNTPGSEVSVPIDNANSAIFRVLNIPAWTPAGTTFDDRMAVRKT